MTELVTVGRTADGAGAPGAVVEPSALGRSWSYRDQVDPAGFPRTPWGHRGYDEDAVDSFAVQVARDLTAAQDEITDLRAEVDRLHRYIRRQWAAVAAAEASAQARAGTPAGVGLVSPAAQARAVLSQAQEIAERRLAQAAQRLAEADRLAAGRLQAAGRQARDHLDLLDDTVAQRLTDGDRLAAQRLSHAEALAEQLLGQARQDADRCRRDAVGDSHRLLRLARTQYEEIVVRAHQRADRAAEVALDELEHGDLGADDLGLGDPGPDGDTRRVRAELELKTAYLRTFAKASRGALQAALDVTAREFDQLLGVSARAEPVADPPPAATQAGI